jgi:hypothetical protein
MAQIRLTDALRRLNAEHGGTISYQKLFLAVASGRVPAERDHTGSRWVIDEANLPAVAAALGLTGQQSEPPAPSKRSRKAA